MVVAVPLIEEIDDVAEPARSFVRGKTARGAVEPVGFGSVHERKSHFTAFDFLDILSDLFVTKQPCSSRFSKRPSISQELNP